jgi:hypothetical protein
MRTPLPSNGTRSRLVPRQVQYREEQAFGRSSFPRLYGIPSVGAGRGTSSRGGNACELEGGALTRAGCQRGDTPVAQPSSRHSTRVLWGKRVRLPSSCQKAWEPSHATLDEGPPVGQTSHQRSPSQLLCDVISSGSPAARSVDPKPPGVGPEDDFRPSKEGGAIRLGAGTRELSLAKREGSRGSRRKLP